MINQIFYKEIESKIVANLIGAKKNVKIALAWFTNPTLFNLILKLKKNEIEIELILSDDKINYTNKKVDFQNLINENVEFRISEYPKLMHNKFCIIDDKILINGSYNWTLKAEKINFENIIISTDRKLVNDFSEYFEYLKLNTVKVTKVNKIDFKDYSNFNEINSEVKLLENEILTKEITLKSKKETEYSEEIENQIDKAELLYLSAKNEECIEFCKTILKNNPEIQELYTIMAKSYWRLFKFKELIESANKAIELNREDYEAYNLLGIGYSNKKGDEQKSIENYEICIKKYPNEDAFYRNRALSNIELENEINLPAKFREKYKEKADKDLQKIIQIVDNKKTEELSYSNLHSRAFAYHNLNKFKNAKTDIEEAIKMYNEETEIFNKDKNEFLEMKQLLKELKNV